MRDHQFGHFGPHDFGAFGPSHSWLPALLTGLSLLWWIGVPLLLLWVGSRTLSQRQPEPLLQPAEQSASEMLRQRYVLGEIDATTFEQMLERVMFSEAQERSGHPLIPRGAPRAEAARVRIWEPQEQPAAPDERDQPPDNPPPAPLADIEMV